MEVREGYKQTEVGVIPEDWDLKKLSELTTLMTNGFVGTATSHYTEFDNGVIYIQGFNVEENAFNFTGIKRVTQAFHKKHSKSCLQEGDLLTVQTGDVGLTTIIPKSLVGSNCHALIITRVRKQKIDPHFISYYLNSHQGRSRLKEIETGTTMKHINVGDMVHFDVPLPPTKAEQTAIATALSDADALIQSMEKLIAKKRLIKQGSMQKLLKPKEGWVVKKLGEVCFPSKKRINPVASPDNYKCVELEHVSQETGRLLGYVDSKGQLSQKSYFGKGDVLFGKLRPYLKKFFYADFDGVCSTEIWVLKAESGIVSKWLYYLIQTNNILEAANQSTGTKMPRAEWSTVENVDVFIPTTVAEQSRIATILSDMDTEISAIETKLAKYKQVKQGMMQNLLTGRIRLV